MLPGSEGSEETLAEADGKVWPNEDVAAMLTSDDCGVSVALPVRGLEGMRTIT